MYAFMIEDCNDIFQILTEDMQESDILHTHSEIVAGN